EALPGERKCHARRVDGNPSSAPVFGGVGCGPTTASGVQDEVAGVCGHENTTLNHLRIRLHDKCLGVSEPCRSRVVPQICQRARRKVVQIAEVGWRVPEPHQAAGCAESLHAASISLPPAPSRKIRATIDLYGEDGGLSYSRRLRCEVITTKESPQ